MRSDAMHLAPRPAGAAPLPALSTQPAPAHAAATAAAISRHAQRDGALLPLLHDVQAQLGFIPPACVNQIAQALNLSRAEVHGVITYYPHFRSCTPAPHRLEVCRAEACQAMGGDALAEHAQARLGCGFHERDAAGAIDLEPVYCLGLCAQSPAVALDGRPHARMNAQRLDRLLDSLKNGEAA